MIRSMTRTEYYEQRQFYRTVMACVQNPESRDRALSNKAFRFVFSAVYDQIPRWFFDCQSCSIRHVYSIKESRGLLLNCKYSPNSYPHKTRNP